jgi:hypothetical protein
MDVAGVIVLTAPTSAVASFELSILISVVVKLAAASGLLFIAAATAAPSFLLLLEKENFFLGFNLLSNASRLRLNKSTIFRGK